MDGAKKTQTKSISGSMGLTVTIVHCLRFDSSCAFKKKWLGRDMRVPVSTLICVKAQGQKKITSCSRYGVPPPKIPTFPQSEYRKDGHKPEEQEGRQNDPKMWTSCRKTGTYAWQKNRKSLIPSRKSPEIITIRGSEAEKKTFYPGAKSHWFMVFMVMFLGMGSYSQADCHEKFVPWRVVSCSCLGE